MPLKTYIGAARCFRKAVCSLPARFAFVIILFPLLLSSQIIGEWTFSSTTNGTSGTFNTVSIADFSPAIPSKAYNAGSEYFGHDGWPTGAIDLSRYMQFQLTPNTGYALNLLSLILRMRHSSTGPSGGSGPTRFSVRSSLDGYATDIATGSLTGTNNNFTILPGVDFNNLPTAITFRIYGYMAIIYTGGINRFVFDNIQVTAIGLVLPVNLLSFSAKSLRDEILIDYCLDNTIGGSEYSLEQSDNGIQFKHLSAITETTTSAQKTYHISEKIKPSEFGLFYYRLKIREPGGNTYYSPVVSVKINEAFQQFNASIINGVMTITGEFPINSDLIIHNSAGACLYRAKIQAGNVAGTSVFSIPALAGGTYYLTLSNQSGKTTKSVLIR